MRPTRRAPLVSKRHFLWGRISLVQVRVAEDHFIPFHQTADFSKALVNARSVTTRVFDRASGGAAHCQVGCTTLVHVAIFDWLVEKFADSAASRDS